MSKAMRYSDAGVNIDNWNSIKDSLAKKVKSTFNANVVGKFGQFAGMYRFDTNGGNILVASIDGVGTKVKIAVETDNHENIGFDIVNHCVNDILVLGARPIFFLDYFGTGVLDLQVFERVVSSLSKACKQNKCVLIGGETAEMPDTYPKKEYDLVGCIIGIVEDDAIIDGSNIEVGDCIIGLESNGLHTNGYSLARKIIKKARKSYSDYFEGTGKTFGEELLKPHRAYSPVLDITEGMIKGIAHITGGGFTDNIDRILPKNVDANIKINSWEPLSIFQWLVDAGKVPVEDAYRTFNMGIGMTLVIDPQDCDIVMKGLKKFKPKVIGEIIKGSGKVNLV